MATQGSLRLAKLLVFGMLGLIVVLTAVVVGTVGVRLFGGKASAPVAAEAGPVALPPGARIEAVDGASGRVLLLLVLPDGRQSLVAIENGQATSLAETTED
jgi:hypothetical protein